MYLVDMRNPLQVIIDSVYSIVGVSDIFKDNIFSEINRTHKNNWYLRHQNENLIIDKFCDEEENDKTNEYNPLEWQYKVVIKCFKTKNLDLFIKTKI